jgi:hypothetical protein
MSRNSQITVGAILILVIAGCAPAEDAPKITATPAPSVASSTPAMPKAVVPQIIANNSQPINPPFGNPVVSPPGVPSLTPPTIGQGLIQSTNATERGTEVLKGRTDPFAQVGGISVPDTLPSKGVKSVPKLPRLPIRLVPKATPVASNIPKNPVATLIPIAKKPKNNSVLPRVLPQVVPNPKLVSVLPPTENPDLARAIFVSGIVQTSLGIQAIIKVPDEPTSRYVRAGQPLVNGVLVKRIEMNQGSDPVVVLEQYGIEVAKTVGEKPVNSKPGTTAAVVEGSLINNRQVIN